MQITAVAIEKPADMNVVIGQAHFIKTVEDLHEAIVNTNPSMKFGLAFCEASGPCLVRFSGNDPHLINLAKENAFRVGCGHTFFIFLTGGFPVNILNAVKQVPEVCSIFCATANPLQVLVAESGDGRGIAGVIDGSRPKGMETDTDIEARKGFLRKIGYKFS